MTDGSDGDAGRELLVDLLQFVGEHFAVLGRDDALYGRSEHLHRVLVQDARLPQLHA